MTGSRGEGLEKREKRVHGKECTVGVATYLPETPRVELLEAGYYLLTRVPRMSRENV